MKIHIDGIIYNSQKIGGISRYFSEYLSRIHEINAETKIEILLHKDIQKGLPQNSNIKFNLIKKLHFFRFSRLFQPVIKPINDYIQNRYWSNIKDGIFHSTYFTTYKNLKIPQVLTVYDMIYEKFPNFFNKKKDLEFIKQKKKCIDSADAIICISESTKKDLINIYNIDKNKIFITYLGVNSNFKRITDENIKKGFLNKKNIQKPYLLYVGWRHVYKNFSTFVKAFNMLSNQNLDMIVVGGGKFTKKETDTIKELNLENKIHNLGFVSDEELIMLYNCTATFVFPTLYEGFGIPILEAMACGTPMALSNSSSLPEIAGNSALYFDPKNINDMTKKIQQSVSEGRNSNRVKLGLDRIKRFSWDKTARETFNIYIKTLKKKRGTIKRREKL